MCDYLDNNRLIAYYCGFGITKPLPYYWTYIRFLKNLDNSALLKKVMEDQVLRLAKLGITSVSFAPSSILFIACFAHPYIPETNFIMGEFWTYAFGVIIKYNGVIVIIILASTVTFRT